MFLIVAAFATTSDALATPFEIHWTAPGDDSVSGRASVYDLRYSSAPIAAANFHLATPIAGLPSPSNAGTLESFVVTGIPDGGFVYMAIKSADEAGNWSAMSNIMTWPIQSTGVGDLALTLSFSSPWPNPARQTVRWAYALPQAARMQVDVFDLTGRHIHTVASGDREAGRGELSWNLRDERGQPVGAGVYFVKARLGTLEWTKRLIIVR